MPRRSVVLAFECRPIELADAALAHCPVYERAADAPLVQLRVRRCRGRWLSLNLHCRHSHRIAVTASPALPRPQAVTATQ